MRAIPIHLTKKDPFKMADTTNKMNDTREQGSSKMSNETSQREQGKTQSDNQTMQHERAKGSVSGDREEKGAIGGGKSSGQSSGQSSSQTGEPGRARSELNQDKNRSEFDKKGSEPTGR